MRRNNWKKYIIILIAFIVGLVANLAARAILPRLLPAGMQAWTGSISNTVGDRNIRRYHLDHYFYKSHRGGLGK